MGMGYAPCSGYVITWEKLKELLPKHAAEFESALGEMTVDEFCEAMTYDDLDNDSVIASWERFAKSFRTITTVGKSFLTIEPGYHDADNGNRYDNTEVDGGFFFVDGMMHLTPAGETFKDLVTFAQWTDFG